MNFYHETRNMNGLTSEAAVNRIGGSRYEMIHIACARVRELKRGHASKLDSKQMPMTAAIMEIEQGLIGTDYLHKVA